MEVPFKSKHVWQILQEEITNGLADLPLTKIEIVEREGRRRFCRVKQFITVRDQATLFSTFYERPSHSTLTRLSFLGRDNRAETGENNGAKFGAVLHVRFVVIQ